MNKNCERQVGRLLKAMAVDPFKANGAYIRGESNPKSVLIDAGKSVLKYMAKDLGLVEYKVYHNAGGNGVPGEATLIGLWGPDNGIYVKLSGYDPHWYNGKFMYRTVKNMRDFTGGMNQWTPLEQLRYDWQGVIAKLAKLNLTN